MKYIVIGAVAGGASTAARLRRLDEHAEIIMYEKGEYISYANCGLPYYIGGVIKDRNNLLVQTAESFHQRFNIEVRSFTMITEIDPIKKTITAIKTKTNESYVETYDKLVLAPGAEPLRPPLPGINNHKIVTLRNVNDTDYVKAFINDNHVKQAVIIGAGFIGLEMAENLVHLGIKVTVVEMGNQILAPIDYEMAAIAQNHLRSKGVNLLLNTAVTEFVDDNKTLQVLFKNGEKIQADMVLLSIGVKPDTSLAVNANLKLGEAKGIWVNEFLQTSNPDIYAVGDAIEFENTIINKSMNTYLAGPANKQGRICANNIVSGNTQSYHGSINTAIVKLFDLTIATAGMAAKHLSKFNIPFITSTTHNGSHASYYPGATEMTIQIAFSPDNGRLIGGQIVGIDGVDKRIDILSSVIQKKGTIADLIEFEHAYAPPYSSAKDPINMAGFVAENILEKRLNLFYWKDVYSLTDTDILIDVRRADEYADGKIKNAINIPIDDFRNHIKELDPSKTIYLYCLGGLRGYLAQQILKQNGFNKVFNLSGGYQLWNESRKERALLGDKQMTAV